MTKYTFLEERDDDIVTKKEVYDALTWTDLMIEFVFFLRGCGYYINDGEFVENTKVSEEMVDNVLDGGLDENSYTRTRKF